MGGIIGGHGIKVREPLEKVPASFGECRNVRNCGNWSVDLGDGYCVECWDGGINRKGNKERKKYGYGKRKKRGIDAETET